MTKVKIVMKIMMIMVIIVKTVIMVIIMRMVKNATEMGKRSEVGLPHPHQSLLHFHEYLRLMMMMRRMMIYIIYQNVLQSNLQT